MERIPSLDAFSPVRLRNSVALNWLAICGKALRQNVNGDIKIAAEYLNAEMIRESFKRQRLQMAIASLPARAIVGFPGDCLDNHRQRLPLRQWKIIHDLADLLNVKRTGSGKFSCLSPA